MHGAWVLLTVTLPRRLAAEALGTAALLAMVVGSGIAGERLSGGNVALALLVNAVATAAGLIVLIFSFGPLSGAHFNPAVTLALAVLKQFRWNEVAAYVLAQLFGAVGGVVLAHAMFGLPLVMEPTHARTGEALLFSETIATVGLVLTITLVSRAKPELTPWAVGLFILSAYFFTSSTSFANPAVTLARGLTDTFSGIRRLDVPGFAMAQVVGALAGAGVTRWFSAPAAPARAPSPPEAGHQPAQGTG